jgi:predicted enzyme involved in methoxymalonyl-ACP biosynthesis
MNIDSKSANIDTFLISCRIIGRNVELAFFDFLVKRLVRTGINTIISKYIQTQKNSVVRNFYEKLSFEINNQSKETTEYELVLDQYKPHNLGYISVIYE